MELNKSTTLAKRSKRGEREAHAFSIGDSSVIIDILRNRLYAHPIRTIVQEYISNAIDANREVGAPISKVTIQAPSAMEPVFRVRDTGPGLTPERIIEVFTKYGNSTKRTTNDQIGGFGIGAKSAWAYSPMFTVRSFSEGRKRTYLAHLGDSSSGTFEKIGDVPSDEETGVEVEIPVQMKDIRTFHEAIARMVAFQPGPGEPLVHRVAPEYASIYRKLEKIIEFDSIWAVTDALDWARDYDTLSIGGVPYELSRAQLSEVGFPSFYRWVIHAKVGEIEVAASRESIVEGPALKKFLKRKVQEAQECIRAHVRDELRKCTNYDQHQKMATVHHRTFHLFEDGEKIEIAGLEFTFDVDKGEPEQRPLYRTDKLTLPESVFEPYPHQVVEIGQTTNVEGRSMRTIEPVADHLIALPDDIYFVIEDKQYTDTTKTKVLSRHNHNWMFARMPTCPASPDFFPAKRFHKISSLMPERGERGERTNYFLLGDPEGWSTGTDRKVRNVTHINAKPAPDADHITNRPIVFVRHDELDKLADGRPTIYKIPADVQFVYELFKTHSSDYRTITYKAIAVLTTKECEDLERRGYKLMHYVEFFEWALKLDLPEGYQKWVHYVATAIDQYGVWDKLKADQKLMGTTDVYRGIKSAIDSPLYVRWTEHIRGKLTAKEKKSLKFLEVLGRSLPSESFSRMDECQMLAYARLGARHPEELAALVSENVDGFLADVKSVLDRHVD